MNLIQKITALFSEEIKFQDVKAQDGTVLRISDSIAPGAKVEVINEDGTLSSPSSKEIILEDGSVLILDDNGMIAEVKQAEAPAEAEEMATDEVPAEPAQEELEEEKPAEEKPQEGSDVAKRVDALEAKVTELVNAVNTLIEHSNQSREEMEAVKKENEELSKKASAPAANFKKFERVETKIEKANASTLERILARKNK